MSLFPEDAGVHSLHGAAMNPDNRIPCFGIRPSPERNSAMNKELAHMLRTAPLSTPTALSADAVRDISAPLAERVRKIGGTTLRSAGHVTRVQRILDNDAEYVSPPDMLAELRDDNAQLSRSMRQAHLLCDEAGDVATASLLENWIDETERRTLFLFECTRQG